MILTRHRKQTKEIRSEFWLLLGLLALLLMGLGYILYHYQYRQVGLEKGEVIFCDAERVRGDNFVRESYKFGKGDLQSGEVAHSGWYSCRVPEGEGGQYGFNYKMEVFQPGEVYQATVWRYKNQLNEGKLAVNGQGATGFYYETSEVRSTEGGWEMLSVTFHIPYQSEIEWVNVYVYTSGYQAVFFDDLEIKRIDFWEEKSFQPQVLRLEIGAGNWQQLEEKRLEAIQTGILFSDSGDWVNGRIRQTKDAPIPVRLRLKGDWLDHLAKDKWSFRVKVRDPYHWNHLKVFSLHTPAARYHLHEWLLHRLWEKEDVLTTRYDLIELQIDGESKGIYAWEEHFAKQLVESRRRREGPILKLNEEGMWLAYQRQLAEHGFITHQGSYSAADWRNADIEAFEEEDLQLDTLLAPMLAQAKNLLAGYFSGNLDAARVFDLEQMASYYAACDVLNGYHGIVWHNQRFYYNPITDRLEPVGFDGFGGPPEDRYTFLGEGALNPQSLMSDNIFHRLFQDTAFTALYVRKLYLLSSRGYFDTFLDSLQGDWTARKEWIQMEFPGYSVGLKDLRERARFLHSLILPFRQESVKARRLSGISDRVVVHNTHSLPVEIIGWGANPKRDPELFTEPIYLPGQIPRTFLSRLRADSLIRNFAQLHFLEDAAISEQAVMVPDTLTLPPTATYLFFRPLGLDTLFHSRLYPAVPEPGLVVGNHFRSRDLEPRPFFSVVEKTITFYPGEHEVRRSIYIPKGYQVDFPAGTSLDLQAGAAFVSWSPVFAMGTPEAPVRIHSSDGRGQGFTVLEAETASVLKNVDFSGLNTLNSDGWHLTGAVNFYQSAVRIYRCRFADNHCEDALNIIRSEFQLDACRFERTFSDAFDSDFSKGEIRNCAFLNTGNDGLDISGSVVNVFESQFDTNGDKGISVGEESDAHVFNCSFRHAPIALACKDLSMLYARNVTIADCEQGFAAYQKKPEFGGATIIVESYKAENVRRLFVEGEGSSVQIGLEE